MEQLTLKKIHPYEPIDLLIDSCGMEHPRLEGNYCINSDNHEDEHEDLAGNQWLGVNYA